MSLLEVMMVLAVFIIWVISGVVLANELWDYSEERFRYGRLIMTGSIWFVLTSLILYASVNCEGC